MENGPFIDDRNDELPIEKGDLPCRYVKLPEDNHG